MHYEHIPSLANVYAKGKKKHLQFATLLFSSGCTLSLISEQLLEDVKHELLTELNLTVSVLFEGECIKNAKVFEISLMVKGDKFIRVKVLAVPTLFIRFPCIRPIIRESVLEEFEHLDLSFNFEEEKETNIVNIDMLIGQDLYWTLMRNNIFRPKNSKIVAQESVFGWILGGNCSSGNDTNNTQKNSIVRTKSGRVSRRPLKLSYTRKNK